MADRLSLQTLLETILGSRNVYFSPPASVHMSYPAIVYSLATINKRVASDKMYSYRNRYSVILIHKNPDNTIVKQLLALDYCRFSRYYVSDNLNHYDFELYY